ncbi:MAG: outer membrane beta-barrel protein [Chitinophagaceae bacterium]
MKKIILPALVLFAATITSNAQIKKGSILLGGQISATAASSNVTQNNTTTTQQKSSGYSISPAFGKAIKENLIIGADLLFSHQKNDYTGGPYQKGNDYGLGVFVRQYKQLGKYFYFFTQLRAGGSYGQTDFTDNTNNNDSHSKGYSFQLAVYPGIAYSVNNKLQIEAGFNNLAYIQFSHNKQWSDANNGWTSKTNNFSLGSSLSNFAGPSVGFRLLFN